MDRNSSIWDRDRRNLREGGRGRERQGGRERGEGWTEVGERGREGGRERKGG